MKNRMTARRSPDTCVVLDDTMLGHIDGGFSLSDVGKAWDEVKQAAPKTVNIAIANNGPTYQADTQNFHQR